MRGADVLVQSLMAHDVQSVFALSGNQIMPVFDAIFDTEIRLVHTRHEAATVYMAEAYAQVSGQVGVALVTAGGGLGNAVGALIAAQASETPVLLLSGDSPVAQDGRAAFQEMDQVGLSQSLTKGSRRVMRADDMADAVAWAIGLAMRGRRGPVHLALPADVLTQLTNVQPLVRKEMSVDVTPIDMVAFHTSKRPLVILGPSLNETRARGLATQLHAQLQAPVVTMESPRGLNDPALGRIKEAAQQADHVLCLGKPVDFTLGFGALEHWPNATAWDVVLGDEAQLDAARKSLGSRLNTAVMSDVDSLCCQSFTQSPSDRAVWIEQVVSLCQARVPEPISDGLTPHDICQFVQRHINKSDRATLVCDGGEFGQWAQAGLNAPRRMINGTSGIIGGGIGYAIGAKAAEPNQTVFALMGDGTIGFHLSEFETAVRSDLPFVAIIGNDRRWNAEHLIQTRSFGADRQIGCELSAARYDIAVAGLGGFGAHVATLDALDDALTRAIKSGLPACINVEMVGFGAPSF